ncbi:MAG: hypothetical protein V7676_05525 [Parasphingorhabdus sp.]|uniref:hypothetical protein n=1 Tax=Parasphingorhabdus sp. TaxID=2709688 RepID=UPI003000FDE0
MKAFIGRHGLGASSLVLASATRALVALTVNILIFSKLDDESAAAFFQLLFLQSAFIAFVSASGYVRTVRISSERGDLENNLRYYILFIFGSSVAALSLLIILLPDGYISSSNSEQFIISILLIIGGGATALNGVLQGSVILSVGKQRTFNKITIANLLSLVAVGLAWVAPGVLMVATVWALSQTLGAIIILSMVPEARVVTKAALSRKSTKTGELALFSGLVNTASILGMFAFREYWKTEVPIATASFVFFIIRISDMSLQLIYTLVASTPNAVKRFRDFCATSRSIFLLTIIAVISFLVFYYLDGLQDGTNNDKHIIIFAEISSLPLRLFSSITLVYLLYEKSIAWYCWAIIISMLCILVCYFCDYVILNSLGLQFLILIMALALTSFGLIRQKIRL